METKLTLHQVRTYGPVPVPGFANATITATVRYDDPSGNGRNMFSITGEIRRGARFKAGGCIHSEISCAFPDLAPLIRWHLVSSDGPMHYLANTTYWLGYDNKWADHTPGNPPDLGHARHAACWPDLPESLIAPVALSQGLLQRRAHVELVLLERLPGLLEEFRAAVESLGFTF